MTIKTKLGFTLIEILVVVLIIGILGAIALPQYQRAVLKSRFAALMPIAKSMADSNEAYYLEHGEYAGNAEDLPVQGRNSYPDGTELEFGTSSDYLYVLATRNNNFPNNYIVYQKHSENYPGEIHCEALKGHKLANWLCAESLHGTKLGGSLTEGYNNYVLEGSGNGITATAAAVLAGVGCEEGVPEDRCRIVNNPDGSRTKIECATPGNSASCVYTTYNTDQTYTVCNENANAAYDEETGVCSPTKTGVKHSSINFEDFKVTYDEDGNPVFGVSCETYTASQGGCTESGLHWYGEDGNMLKYADLNCASGSVNDDGKCPGGYSNQTILELDPEKGGYYTDAGYKDTWYRSCVSGDLLEGTCTAFNSVVDHTFDEHRNKLTQYSCDVSSMLPDDTCTKINAGSSYSFDATNEYNEQGQYVSNHTRYIKGGSDFPSSEYEYEADQYKTITYDPTTGNQTTNYNVFYQCSTWNQAADTCATYEPHSSKYFSYYNTYDPTTGKQTSGTDARCTNYADNTDRNSCTNWSVTVTPYVNGKAQTGSKVTGTCAPADFDIATGTCSNLQS